MNKIPLLSRIASIRLAFSPNHVDHLSCRMFLNAIDTPKLRTHYPTVKIAVECDEQIKDPLVQVTFINDDTLEVDCRDLQVNEIKEKVRRGIKRMMLMPKAHIKLIHQHLLAEGVLVVKKDTRAPSHPTIPVPNLHVMKLMQSLKSRGFVKEQFNWQYHYYFVTDEGVAFLRNVLHVGEEVIPATHCVKAGSGGMRRDGGEREERGERTPRARKGDEGEYRRSGPWRRQEGQATA